MLQMVFSMTNSKTGRLRPFAAEAFGRKQGNGILSKFIFVEKFYGDAIICSFPDTNFMTGGVEVKLDTALVLEAQKGSRSRSAWNPSD